MKLYETTIELEKLWNEASAIIEYGSDQVADEAILRDIESKMKLVESEQKSLGLHIATMIKNQRAETKALEEELDKLRVERSVKKEEWLISYLQTFISAGTKLSDPRATISWRKSKSVEVLIDVEDLPLRYQKIKITRNPDKIFIKEVLEVGDPQNELEGKAKLVEKENIQIK